MITHAINKQVFELNCPDERTAMALQKQLLYYAGPAIESIIATVLDEMAGEEVVQIDRLQVDLGDLAEEEFGSPQMLQRFSMLLRKQCAGLLEGGRQKEGGPLTAVALSGVEWELVRQFLLSGDIPWWADKSGAPDIDALVQRAVFDKPSAVRTFFESQPADAPVWKRLRWQCKGDTGRMVEDLLSGVSGREKKSVAKTGEEARGEGVRVTESLASLIRSFRRKKTNYGATYHFRAISRLAKNICGGQHSRGLSFLKLTQWCRDEDLLQLELLLISGKGKEGYEKTREILAGLSVFQLAFLVRGMGDAVKEAGSPQKDATALSIIRLLGIKRPGAKEPEDAGPEGSYLEDVTTGDVYAGMDGARSAGASLKGARPEDTGRERLRPEGAGTEDTGPEVADLEDRGLEDAGVKEMGPQDIDIEDMLREARLAGVAKKEDEQSDIRHSEDSGTEDRRVENIRAENKHAEGNDAKGNDAEGNEAEDGDAESSETESSDTKGSDADGGHAGNRHRAVERSSPLYDLMMTWPEKALLRLQKKFNRALKGQEELRQIRKQLLRGEGRSEFLAEGGRVLFEGKVSQLILQALPVKGLTGQEAGLLEDILFNRHLGTGYKKKMAARLLRKLPEPLIRLVDHLRRLPEEEWSNLLPSDDPNTTIMDKERNGEEAQRVLVENAGLCLFAPYLDPFFANLGYLDKGKFKSVKHIWKGIFLLHYIATGECKAPEYLLSLNKLFCDIPLDTPVPGEMKMSKRELREADDLVQSVITNWTLLKSTSPEGLRGSFLCRKGIIRDQGACLVLQVERKEYDILLNGVSWGYSIIKLPWMKKYIQVEW